MKYTDPDGKKILCVISSLVQNGLDGNSLQMGPERTYFTNSKGKVRENTIGGFGCLFTSIINIGNSICKKEGLITKNHKLSEYNRGDYFKYVECTNISGIDCNMYPSHIKQLLKDMTGKDYSVNRIRDTDLTKTVIDTVKNSSNFDAYIVADVGGHFINVTSVDENGNLRFHDTYLFSPDKQKKYTIDDIKGIYLISEER